MRASPPCIGNFPRGRKSRPLDEIAVLRDLLAGQLDAFEKDRQSAADLLGVGEWTKNDSLNEAELAAWTTIASVILGLDETISH